MEQGLLGSIINASYCCRLQLFKRGHPKRRAPGSAGLAACLSCASPLPAARPALPTVANTLRGKSWAARGIPPVSRAVFKLTSRKAATRAATLAWLEGAAAKREPGELSLRATRGAELLVLVRAVRDAREGRSAHASGEEMTAVLVRAVRALGASSHNRRYILDSGALDLLVDAMLGLLSPASGSGSGNGHQPPPPPPQQQQQQRASAAGAATAVVAPEAGAGFSLPRAALADVALLSREDDPRLATLDRRALELLVALVSRPPPPGGAADDEEVLDLALTAITNLARSPANRCAPPAVSRIGA